MIKAVVYRPFKKEDVEFLVSVIIDSWNYEKMFSKKVSYHFAHTFLYFELIRKSFSQVAEIDAKPIGIIIGDVKKESRSFKNYLYYPKLVWHAIHLLLSKEGRNVLLKYAGDVTSLNNKMIKEQNEKFDTEVALFAVSPQAQGLGVGSTLYKYFLDTLKKKKLNKFYLFTDTTCNFGFYEHKGLKRVSAVKKYVKPPVNKEIEFFLYTGKVF